MRWAPPFGKHTQTLRCYGKKAGVGQCDTIHPVFKKTKTSSWMTSIQWCYREKGIFPHKRIKCDVFQPVFVDAMANSSQGTFPLGSCRSDLEQNHTPHTAGTRNKHELTCAALRVGNIQNTFPSSPANNNPILILRKYLTLKLLDVKIQFEFRLKIQFF